MIYRKHIPIALILAFGLLPLVGCRETAIELTPTPASFSTLIPTTTARIPTDTPQPTQTPTQSLTPTPTLDIGSTLISHKDGMVLVYIPEGEFLMGSREDDPDAADDETPQLMVYLDAYWMDQTEVTNAMYQDCVAEGGCDPPISNESYTRRNYYGNDTFDNYPVIYVSWENARAYCEWAGRRLPTEAEWEKAAREEDGRTYPWGEGIDCQRANYWGQDSGCIGDTTSVGSYPEGASLYGVLDMAGNVWEWVSSIYKSYPFVANDGREEMNSSEPRVLRGGSWYYATSRIVRTVSRSRSDPDYSFYGVGFRCARSP